MLRSRFFLMRVVAESIVKAKTCVCCGVVGHTMDACPVRISLTSYFSKEPITKSLFGTVKGIQAGYAAGSDAAQEAIAKRLQEQLQAKIESQELAAQADRELQQHLEAAQRLML